MNSGGMTPRVEICVDSVASARAAERGGADRVELCDNLLEGGTTPSDGLVAVARKNINLGLHILVRPRGGDFCYSDEEMEVMEHDIRRAGELGADGVVFGVLRPDGVVDAERCARFRELAWPMRATFHRAFDMTPDPHDATEAIIDAGFERILSSGQKPTAREGSETLASLVTRFGDRVCMMVGGGVRADHVAWLLERTGAREVHMRLDGEIDSPVKFRRTVPMGGVEVIRPPEFTRHVTDERLVSEVVAEVAGIASFGD